jgi:hypothetical protein
MHKSIMARLEPEIKPEQEFQQSEHPPQLCLDLAPSSQAMAEASPFLQITSVPLVERVVATGHRYQLLIQPHGVRACGGQFTAEEAHQIALATRGWDWRLDEHSRPKCLGRLEQLLDRICKKSAAITIKGGEE